ncbi:hypothetical protein [Accumulibacter sp.]|jgi:DNA gyrase/topoisomerase IV subunit B|uniref:hypothetical protein n=1 Tax=Accumulibacter sp. TaxID=2053492 RepID=UPI0026037D80|nr:hypothetical protein [Accumulibacter sp.]
MTKQTSGTHEQGYKAVLVREETKDDLRKLRSSLSERDLFQERRLATAALELAIEDANNNEQARNRLLSRAREVVVRDLNNSQAA